MSDTERSLKYAVFVLIAAMLALQTWALRGLYADGAYFLVRLLERQSFFDTNEPSRRCMYWFTQFPVVIALKLGVRDLAFLRALFCGWLAASPLLFWGMGLWRLRDRFLFWPYLALFSFIYFNCNFFIIGEYNLCYALAGFCCACLLPGQTDNPRNRVSLFLAALLLILSYPATLFLGPVLGLAALLRLIHEPTPRLKFYWLALICLFLFACGCGLWGYLAPTIPATKAQSLNFKTLAYDQRLWSTALCLAATMLPLAVRAGRGRDLLFLGLLGLEMFCALGWFWTTPYLSYCARAFTGLALCGGCVLIGGGSLARLPARLRAVPSFCVFIPVFILFAALTLLDIQNSFAFHAYTRSFARAVNTHSGYIEQNVLNSYTSTDLLYGWVWTYPSMSLVLRNSAHAAIILNTPAGIPTQIFDPLTALPDLTRYYR